MSDSSGTWFSMTGVGLGLDFTPSGVRLGIFLVSPVYSFDGSGLSLGLLLMFLLASSRLADAVSS